jgi:hypothetical protein
MIRLLEVGGERVVFEGVLVGSAAMTGKNPKKND